MPAGPEYAGRIGMCTLARDSRTGQECADGSGIREPGRDVHTGPEHAESLRRYRLRDSVSVCDKIRTRDLLVRSQTLYPAELHIHLLTSAADDIVSVNPLIVNRICRNLKISFHRTAGYALRCFYLWFKLLYMGAAHQAVGLSARRGIVCPPDTERRDSMLTGIYSAGLRGTAQTVSKKLMSQAPGPSRSDFAWPGARICSAC